MAHFEFVSHWKFKAALEPVWEAVYDAEQWPSWWRGVEEVEVVTPGGPDKVGMLTNQVWKSKLPYHLRFQIEITKVDPMRSIEVAADGQLRGTGLMSFDHDADTVTVRFDWKVETTEAWMNALPGARPVFGWNHAVIMDWGAESLAQKLGVELLSTSETQE